MSEESRPPYVTFENRSIEDRERSIEAGHPVYKDIHFAIITPPGGKDQVEKVAEDWLRDYKIQAEQGRVPMAWVPHFENMYRAYLDGKEMPENGFSILNWPGISKAVADNIIAAGIRTVEDLAVANEVALTAIGMGGQSLKQRAKAWLEAADKQGKPAEKIAALETENSSLKNQVADQAKKIEALEKAVKELKKAPV